MPDKTTLRRARRDARQGKSASTQAGEFVREEIDHIRHGMHGARSAKQAIAIGLSKARRAGVNLPPPAKGRASPAVRKKAKQDLEKGRRHNAPSRKRSAATLRALRKESRRAASRQALSRQAHQAARKRGAGARSQAARKAAATRRRTRARR